MNIEGESKIVEVKPGMTLIQLAKVLHKNGILSHPNYLLWSARKQGVADSINDGVTLVATPAIAALIGCCSNRFVILISFLFLPLFR